MKPYVLGSGRSAQALKESLAVVSILHPELELGPATQLSRGQSLQGLASSLEKSILCLCNPHGLHAKGILEAAATGFHLVLCEKPACTNLEEVAALRKVKIPSAVLHVYRQTWGLQTLKEMVSAGELGEIIAIEGRYWQSSTAQRVAGQKAGGGWKNDTALSGHSDTLLDVGVHWADAAVFLAGALPKKTKLWLSYANAERAHRDTHVHLQMRFESGTRALASISKTVHGAPNHFEVNLIGTKKSATWKFLEPDQIEIGHGASRTYLYRTSDGLGSKHPPFHGLGWIEGYIEIAKEALLEVKDPSRKGHYPRLSEHLDLLEILLKAQSEVDE